MNPELPNASTSRSDIFKWILIALLSVVGIVGYYYFVQYSWPFRVIGEAIIFAIIVGIAKWTALGNRIWHFFRDAYNELKKVVWPSRSETLRTTLVVLAFVVIFSFIIWLIDVALVWIINHLTGQ